MNVSMLEALEVCDIPAPDRMPSHILCPFHGEDTASCAIYEDHWHCFGCSAGGSPLAFVARFFAEGEEPGREHFSYAHKIIARSVDLDDETRPTYERREPEVLDLGGEFECYTKLVSAEAVDGARHLFDVKWPHLDAGWVQDTFEVRPARWALWIPHFDDEGVVRGIKTRSYTDGSKKAVTGSTFTSRLYRTSFPLLGDPPSLHAWLCEGESDTWTMTRCAHAGLPVHVFGLPSGANLWRENFAQELLPYRSVTLFMDRDPTGRKAAERISADLQARGCQVFDYQLVDYGDVTEAYLDGWFPPPIGALR